MSNINKQALTDEAISKAFAGTNFGRDDFKNILAETVIDAAAGWRCGYTATTICTQLGLLTPKGCASALGLRFISEHVQLETGRLKDELEAADAMNKHLELAIRKAEGCSEALRRRAEAAEKRIAKLEAREVVLPDYSEVYQDDIDKLPVGAKLYAAPQLPQPAVGNDFLPKNLDRALGVLGMALPESREEFNLQQERWIQRLIDRVIRCADELVPQPEVEKAHSSVIAEQLAHFLSGMKVTSHERAVINCAVDRLNKNAAMLQGAEPVSQADELPMDYLQGHKDSLEWAARLAEANHPQTGDWLYDDPLELAKAIRKGPDMPVEPMQKLTFREALAAIRNLGPIDAEKIQAERDALNEPDVPDGYALVPLEPTAEMVAAAMLSDDVLFDQDDDTMFRVQHGVIWRDMLAAAPDFREISNSSTKHFRETAETSTNCPHCGRKPLKNRKCSVAGCEGRHVAHGLCQKHYDIKHKNNLSRRKNIRAANKRYRARRSAAPQQEVK